MTIRAAKFADIPRLVDLMTEMHMRSCYVGRDEVDVAEAKQLCLGMIQRVTVKGPGGACAFAAEKDDGTVEGFILGMTERVYHIGCNLMATDVFFYVSERAGPRDFIHLFDAFESWAEANPRVIEIRPGVTDAIDAPERLAKFYERRGYRRSGLMFEKGIAR